MGMALTSCTVPAAGKPTFELGEDEMEVEEGGFFFKPRGIVHALWNPTDHPVVVIEFISPAGFEHFFEEMGALTRADPQAVQEIGGAVQWVHDEYEISVAGEIG